MLQVLMRLSLSEKLINLQFRWYNLVVLSLLMVLNRFACTSDVYPKRRAVTHCTADEKMVKVLIIANDTWR